MDELFKNNNDNEIPLVLVVDNGQLQPIGRKSKKALDRILLGQELHNEIVPLLSKNNLKRPTSNRAKHN